MCVFRKTLSCLLLFVVPVGILVICVRIHSPDKVFAPCVEFAGLSLVLLRPSPVSCNNKTLFLVALWFSPVGPSMKDAVRPGTWVAADGGIPQDGIGLNSRDYKSDTIDHGSDTADQGHDHKMAVTYADVVQGRAKAHSSRKI